MGENTQFNQDRVGNVILPQLHWGTASLGKGSGQEYCLPVVSSMTKTCSCHHHGAAQLAEERNPSPQFPSESLPILGSELWEESGACVSVEEPCGQPGSWSPAQGTAAGS